MARVERVSVHRSIALDAAWELTPLAPGAATDPVTLNALGAPASSSKPSPAPGAVVGWTLAPVPGTVASALRAARAWDVAGPKRSFDASDWWYRGRFEAAPAEDGEELVLRFAGLATVADVWLNGVHILRSENMFHAHDVDVTPLVRGGQGDVNELVIRFHSLTALLQVKRPRPRWRTRLVENQQLRWHRTTLLGRIPGWTPPVAPVGPWRAVTLERRRVVAIREADVQSRLEGDTGVVRARIVVASIEDHGGGSSGAHVVTAASLHVGEARAALAVTAEGSGVFALEGELRIEDVARWWPHTHGAPTLHAAKVVLLAEGRGGEAHVEVDLGRVGFRSIELVTDDGGFAIRVNGVDVFCRGACWTTTDIVTLGAGDTAAHAQAVALARDGGMNMLRVGGTMIYEDDAFYAACDAAGILVWQDFMFANMDYPGEDAAFLASVKREVAEVLARTQGSPCLAVLCGNSEIEQQAAMLGLPRALWTQALFEEVLPAIARGVRPDVPYWTSSPSGGALPFQVSAGVAHYYGVGAYMRPLEDARRSEVRFTSECLGFSNVPEDATIEMVLGDGEAPPNHPAWKARIPRDTGPGWDFEDVRDHYVQRLFGVDPARLRYADVGRWLALGRVATGEAMAATFAEWRRRRSTCRGGLVWFYRDLWPGAGWGVVDATGAPKAAYYYLRRAFQSVALFVSDEGLDGLELHARNDTDADIDASLCLTLYRHGEVRVAEGRANVIVPARGSAEVRGDAMFEHFLDTTHAYRFGPPGHDVAVATMTDRASGARCGEAFHFPGGLPSAQASDLGLEALAEALEDGAWKVTLRTRKLAQSVAIDARGFRADDAYFHIEPGGEKQITLRPLPGAKAAARLQGVVSPLNAHAPVKIAMRAPTPTPTPT